MANLTELPVNSIRGVPKPTNADFGKALVYIGDKLFGWVLAPTPAQLTKLDGIETGAEKNTGSNLGSGASVFAGKTGSNLTFKSIKAGTGVSVTQDGAEITVSATINSSGAATAFLGLSDAPASYLGMANKFVKVNPAGNGLVFGDGVDTSAFAPISHTHTTADITGLSTTITTTGDARYVQTTNFTWSNLSGKPTTFTPATHTHATSDVTGLDTALAAKVNTVNFTWTNLSGKPSTFTPAAHTHAISDVTNLQSSLDAKVATSRTVSAGTGLTGGGDLSANRTISADIATAANVRAATANKLLDAAGVLSAVTPVALTDGATITPDFTAGRAFTVTLAGNRTLANPTNLAPGQSGLIVVTQDATGSRTLSYGSYWKFPGGAPTLSTAAASVDLISYYVVSATQIICSIVKDLK